MPTQATVQQATGNPQYSAYDISDPIVDIRAAVEVGLYQFDQSAKPGGTDKDRQYAKASGASQRKRKRREGNEVHQLVAALWCWRWLVQGPKHRND